MNRYTKYLYSLFASRLLAGNSKSRLASCYIKSIETSSCLWFLMNTDKKELVTAHGRGLPSDRQPNYADGSTVAEQAVPHLFRPLKREKNRGIYDRAS